MELIRAMMGESEFSIADHLQAVKGERIEGTPPQDDANYAKL